MELRDEIFTYGLRQKKLNLFYLLLGLKTLGVATITFLFFVDITELPIYQHVMTNIFGLSMLGIFYVAFFGGLFFLSFPLEFIFLSALPKYNPFLIFLIYIAGLFLSYSLDYIFGYKLSNFAKKVSVQKFYKVKTQINKKGAAIIFIWNLIGVGSQFATMVLGVFKYNKTRLLLIAASAQILKYMVLVAGFIIYNKIYIQ